MMESRLNSCPLVRRFILPRPFQGFWIHRSRPRRRIKFPHLRGGAIACGRSSLFFDRHGRAKTHGCPVQLFVQPLRVCGRASYSFPVIPGPAEGRDPGIQVPRVKPGGMLLKPCARTCSGQRGWPPGLRPAMTTLKSPARPIHNPVSSTGQPWAKTRPSTCFPAKKDGLDTGFPPERFASVVKDMDGRNKPGHYGELFRCQWATCDRTASRGKVGRGVRSADAGHSDPNAGSANSSGYPHLPPSKRTPSARREQAKRGGGNLAG
jgi:hypothetical protein